MPVQIGDLTLVDLSVLEVDVDPSTGTGLTAPTNTLALAADGSGLYWKSGTAATAWTHTSNPFKLLQYTRVAPLSTTSVQAASTLTLTSASTSDQFFTGANAAYIVKLPDATTLPICQKYAFYNTGSVPIDVQDGSGAALFVLGQSSVGYLTLQTNSTAAGGWVVWQAYASAMATGILSYNIISSTTFTTASVTDVVMTGFTVTPQSGTYFVSYTGSASLTTTPKTHWWSIYRAGTQIADSERSQDTAHSAQTMSDATQTVASFDGTQSCDVRVRTQNGSLAVGNRSMVLIRLGS